MARTTQALAKGVTNPKSRSKQASSEADVQIDVSSSDELQEVEQLGVEQNLPKPRSSKPSSSALPVKTNGKGKSKSGSSRTETDTVSDNEVPNIQTLKDEANAAVLAKKKKVSIPSEAKLRSQVERAEKARNQAEASRDFYRKLAEEALQLRETEEQNFADQKAHLEATIAQQASHNLELQDRLNKLEPIQRSAAKTYVLELITRETAEEEKKSVEKEAIKWKNITKEKDKIIAEKEVQIENLIQQEIQLQKELKAEVEHSKTLGSKSARAVPPSSTRGQIAVTDNPKIAEVIKFYEDITNLIIPNVKFATGQYLKIDEPTLSCVYTYNKSKNGNASDDQIKSLSFSLHLYNDPDSEVEEVTSQDHLVPMVTFVPHELDKESREFVEALNFLGDRFTFSRYQLPLFLVQLQQLMAAASSNGEEEEEESPPEEAP